MKLKLTREKKTCAFMFTTDDKDGSGGNGSSIEPTPMTKMEFLKKCEEFYNARGTNYNDYEQMLVKIF